jgi:hypothetical protein
MDIILKYVTLSLSRKYTATPLFSHINLQISPLYARPSLNYCRLLATAQCHYNPCVLFRYAVHLFYFVLKHCLTTTCYCGIKLMSSQFKMHPNIAVIVTGLQSGWLRNPCPVLARNKEILLRNVLTGCGAHPASYWAPHALSLGLNWPGPEADSPTPSEL